MAATGQGLVAFDAQGDVAAGLAESWIVSDGGQSYIFRLRRAKWANGQPVKADMVAKILQQRMRASPDLLAGLTPEVRAMTDRIIEVRLENRPAPPSSSCWPSPASPSSARMAARGLSPASCDATRLYLQPMATDPDEDDEDGKTEVRPADRRRWRRGAPPLRWRASRTGGPISSLAATSRICRSSRTRVSARPTYVPILRRACSGWPSWGILPSSPTATCATRCRAPSTGASLHRRSTCRAGRRRSRRSRPSSTCRAHRRCPIGRPTAWPTG